MKCAMLLLACGLSSGEIHRQLLRASGHAHANKTAANEHDAACPKAMGSYKGSCKGCGTDHNCVLTCRECDNGVTGVPSAQIINLFASHCDLSLGCTAIGNLQGSLVCEDGEHHCEKLTDVPMSKVALHIEEEQAAELAEDHKESEVDSSVEHPRLEHAEVEAAMIEHEEERARAHMGQLLGEEWLAKAEGRVQGGNEAAGEHAKTNSTAHAKGIASDDEDEVLVTVPGFAITREHLIYGMIGLAGFLIACFLMNPNIMARCCRQRQSKGATLSNEVALSNSGTPVGIGTPAGAAAFSHDSQSSTTAGGFALSPRL